MKKDLNKNENSEIAIKVEHVSKTFRIPHEKVTSIRGAVTGVLSRKKGYEEFKALDDVSFEVKKGEFFGIIGRNGSGKSTLLKILAGIYQADAGKVKINGMISPFLELGIGFNPELSGRDNVYLNATVLGMTKKQIDEKFDDIVKFSELERFIDQKLKNYSSGMQVRLAFSVSIHANRDILLMDEVLAVGDSNFQSKCLEEFNKYRDRGRTVIIVTHDISVVEKYCDRALLIRSGRIIKIDKADKVANEYIQGNIEDEEERLSNLSPSSNIFPGVIESEKNNSKKIAEITSIKFSNREGVCKNVFKTDDCVDIRIEFNVFRKVDVINIGFGIHSVIGDHILGCNTQIDDFKIENNNFVILRFDRLSLLSGEYYIDLVCFGKFEQNYYDIKQKFKFFKMIATGKKMNYRGTCDLKHGWIN